MFIVNQKVKLASSGHRGDVGTVVGHIMDFTEVRWPDGRLEYVLTKALELVPVKGTRHE